MLCILMPPYSYLGETKVKYDAAYQSFLYLCDTLGKEAWQMFFFLLQLCVYWERGRAWNLRYAIFLTSHIHEKRKKAGRRKYIQLKMLTWCILPKFIEVSGFCFFIPRSWTYTSLVEEGEQYLTMPLMPGLQNS